MDCFFYGTLLDADVRRLVLGAHAPTRLAPARLVGWRRVKVRGECFPVIQRQAGAIVSGLLARALDADARGRLIEYEGRDAYALVAVDVTLADGARCAAETFVPLATGPLTPTRTAWSLEGWRRRDKRTFLAALRRGAGG
jgi:hypothetical protein